MSEMDELGRREVLHMRLTLARAIEEELLDYERSRAARNALTEMACATLNDLYQAIGAAYDHAPET